MSIFAVRMKAFIKNKQLFTLQLFNFLRQGSLLLISVFLAKGNADISQIAGFETAMLLSASFSFFTIAALGHCLYPMIAAVRSQDRSIHYFHAFILFSLSGLLAALLILISSFGFQDEYFSADLFWYPALYILFNAGTYLTDNYFVIENKLKSAIAWGILSFFIQIGLICYPLIYLNNLETALMLLAAFAALRFLFTFALIRKIVPIFQIRKTIILSMFHRSWPVMISLLLGSGFIYVNQYLVKSRFDASEFALFRYGTREFPLFAILTNSFSSIYSARYASNPDLTGNQGIRRLSHQVFIPAIILIWLSEWLFKILFNEALAESWILFNIVLLIVPSKLVFPQSVLLAIGKSNYLLYASIFESAVGVIFSLWLIPIYGLTGAAWALLIAHVAEKSALMTFCYHNKIPLHHFTDLKSLLPYLSALIFSFVLNL